MSRTGLRTTYACRQNGWDVRIPKRVARLRADSAARRPGSAREAGEARGAAGGARRVPGEVRRRAAQVQVPLLDLRLRRLLRLAGRLVVRDRADRAAVRARDGARGRGQAAGSPGFG